MCSSTQGWGCSPIKGERELGLDRRETGWLLSTGSVWLPEGKVVPVREERTVGASGLPVIRVGIAGRLRAMIIKAEGI